MKKKIKRHLLLEQLEDRIFLSASPLAAVGPADHVAESEPVDLHAHDTLVPATETQHTAASDSGHVTPAGQEQPKAAETSESTNSANNMGAEHGNQSKPDDAEAIDNDHDNQADAQTVAGSVQQADQAAVSSETHGTQATDTGTADNADQAVGGVDTTIQTDSDTSAGIATDQVRDGQNADHESTTAAGENTPLSDAADPTTDHVNPDGTDTINTTDLADAGTDRADSEAADNTANNEVALADAADAVATDDQAIDPMIGEDFTFTTTFDNTTGSDVFGPYIDLLLDGGQDGSDAATDDGISFVSATYLNADVESTIIDITQNEVDNGITHPWATDNTGAPLIVHDIDGQTFHVGDQFVSLRMPFGSFTPDQPAAEVQVTAHMGVNADVDVNLGVHTTTGAMYGHDALDNPASDSPLRGAANGLAQETVHYKPEVITYRKDIIVPNVGADCQEQHAGTDDIRHFADDGSQIFEQNHQEIPTGPNFPATYVATIDVADGQEVTNLNLTEHLPDNIVYTGNVTVQVGGVAVAHTINLTGSDLVISLDNSVTGTANGDDVVITYDFYVPDQTTTGTDILNPATGDDGHIINDGEVGYSWQPNDGNDPNVVDATIDPEVNADGHFSDNPNVDDISHAQSIAIQKDHALDNDAGHAGYTPGDRVRFTLDFEISDYFGFGNIVIDDLLADGMDLLAAADGFAPTITIAERGTDIVTNHELTIGSELVTGTNGTNDETLHFDISQIIGGDGVLDGGYTDGHTDGATRGTITYWAEIQQNYVSPEGGGEANIDQGDLLTGGVTIEGDIYDYQANALTANSEADESCDSIDIITGSVDKDIYAVTNSTGTTYNPGDNPHLSPGDTVTYRIHYAMPFSSTEDFKLTDYLPLPVFDVSAYSWSNTADATIYDGTTTPAAGHWGYTTNDSYHNLDTPDTVSIGAGNTIIFDYGEYHDGGDTNAEIEIVFTVTVSDEPFADGMFLTNQVRATEQGTPLADNNTDAIVQIVLDEPDLTIDKIANPASGIDAGDTVTFTVTVENTGNSSAFDTIIKDTLPDGFDPSAVTFTVTQGANTLVAGTDFNWTGGGIDGDINTTGDNFFADPGTDGIYGTADDGNDGGIELIDGTNGQLDPSETVVITYTLTAANAIGPNQTLTNTATITNFAGAEGATDHTSQDISDNAVVQATNVTVDKSIADTSQPDSVTSGSNVTIGETVTYSVTITLPEGSATNVRFADAMDLNSGLEIISLDSLTDSSGGDILSSLDGGNTTIDDTFLANHGSIAGDNLSFSIDFGNLENQNRDNATTETITLTYTALVRNISHNQSQTDLNNTARWNWTDGNGTDQSANDTETVTIVEPDLQVTKTAPAGLTPDAGDTFTYTLVVGHDGSTSTSDAFDAVLSDPILAGLTYAGNLTSTGAATASLAYDAGTNSINATWDILAQGTTTTITFDVTVDDPIQAGTDLTNTAGISWTSLPDGDPGTNDVNERTGDGGINDYTATDTLTLTVAGTIDKLDPVPATYTIGDEVTYDIVVSLPEGTTDNLVVTDALPAGMEYINSQVVQVVSGNTFNGTVTTTPTVNDTAGDGNDITWSFGNITVNTDNNTANNSFIVRVTALVTDIPGNHDDPDAGGPALAASLVNEASMTYDDPDGGTIFTDDPTDPVVTVIEPWIETTKDVRPTTHVEAGDVLTYTVNLQNGGNATAYEVNFNDTLAPGTTFGSVQTAEIGGAGVSLGTTSTSGSVITFSDDTWDLDPGQVLTLTYTVNVTSAALVDGTHTNTVDADWSSQNGTDSNERVYDENDGIDSPVDGGANGDRDVDTAVFAMDPVTIAKSDGGVTEATIGDTITYTLTINSPQGTIDNFAVEDVLSQGLIFNDDAVISTASGSFSTENSQAPTFTLNDGSADVTITWDLGDTVVSTDDPILITYTATVANVNSNFLGEGLGNTASIEYDNAQGGHETPAPVTDGLTVAEPQITTDKTVVDSADTGTDASPGETLTYTARFTNTGDSTAYEVTVDDILPVGVDFDPSSAITLVGTGILNAVDINASYDANAQTINFTNSEDGWDLLAGGWFEIHYTVTVMSAGFTAGSYTNTVDADWSSQDGTDPNERVYDDSGNSPVDGTQDENNAAFNVVATASLGDTVFFDAAGDGGAFDAASGDVGISGVDVTISADVDGDGTPEFTQTVRTDADGNYLFTNLAAFDNYVISVDPATSGGANPTDLTASGYHQTYDLDEGTVALDNTATSISLSAGQNRTDIDFGYTGQNSVGDTVWFDVNGNGGQDTGEDGIGGLTVTLTADIDGDSVDEYTTTTTTDENGHYSFDHLPAGDYDITVTPSDGSTPTYDQDSGTGSPDNTTPFTLAADQDRDDIDFGIQGTGSIGDYVWYDANADTNSQNDGPNAGLAGVTVTLSGDIDGDGTIDYTTSTTTAADGSYLFDHLLGGTYTITVDDSTLPGGSSNWSQTFDRDEGTNPPALDNTATDIVLAPGQNRDDVDFGYTGTGSLGDTVWYDANGNGVQEGTELGLAGVTVTISADVDGDGTAEYTHTAITDANGNYLFDHLPAADYTISVDTNTLPAGATPTYDLDSATSSPDSTTLYTLATGEHTDRVDFGYTGTGSIGDTVWNDINGDGVQDTSENGFGGVTVTLTGDFDHDGQADDTLTTTTDADGHYSFDNLFLGAYMVAVDPATLPAGNSQTHDLDDPHSTTPTTPNTAAVTLDAANPINNDVDFGYNSKSTIGDTIWYDADNDGVQDPGEPGLAGVTVTLTGDVDGDGSQDTVIATTDADGHYLFDQLQAGDYTITVSDLPAGMAQTADPDGTNDNTTTLTLGGGETNLDQDFGYTGTGTIGDTIWNDGDGDGSQNNGESGLAGVTVTLRADLNNDGILDTVTTTTDANGNYHFDNLPADDYTITVDPATLPPGMNQTADPDGGNDNTADVTLAAGETNNDQDFGYQQTGTIGDTIWYDADGDGIQDPGELGLNGVTVTLTDGSGNTVATTTTASDGKYLFDNLTAGDYTITLTGLPNGMTQTADPDGGNDNSAQVTIGGSSPLVDLDQDFGYTGTGSIGDTIWNDADGNSAQNNGETGLAGVTVTLSGDFNGDGVPDTVTTTTDANGQYHFERLPEGQYTITVDPATLPPGMQQTADPDGGNDNTADVTLLAGETNNDQDFGYQQSGTIGDTIWYDADGDGVQDPGELGLANVQVTLVGDLDGDGQADDTLTTVTDANGHYLFDKLPAGSYAITVDPATLPGGMEETHDLDGTGSANTAQVTIGDHEANLDVDFGYKGTGSIGDTIWYDVDNDGVQDPGEVGIPGVTVTITGDFDNDGQADDSMTVTTGPDGTYLFPNLPAGEYDITIDPTTLPGGMQPAGDPDGTLDNTTHLSLNAGEVNLDQDFGYTGTGSIGDQLWNDRNGNGILDPGEAPLPGVEVCIGVDLDGDGTPDFRATTTTGADGTYLFDNLPAGAHTVCVNPATLPPGIRPSFDPDGTNDNATVVNLGAGENNADIDFAYVFPPKPVPPVTPVVPPAPVPPAPVPPTPGPGFASDPLLPYQQFGDKEIEDIFLYPFEEIPWQIPVLPVTPIYTGHAEPGTTLEFILYDVMGNQIGQQSIMADTAGNWLASFPDTIMYDLPHHMAITQNLSSYNVSSAGFFNMRTYFSPNFSSMVFSSTELDIDTIFAYLPSTILNSMHAGNMSIFNIQWNDFNEYEFFAPSTQPAKTGH